MTPGRETRPGRWSRSFGWRLAGAIVLLISAACAVLYVRRPVVDPPRQIGAVLADIESRRWKHAEAGIARLERWGGPTSTVWMLRAQLAEARGNLEAALACTAHIADGDRQGAMARLKEGEWERRRHRLRGAEAALLRCLERDGRLKRARFELSYIYGLQLRGPEVRAQYRALDQQGALSPQDVCNWCRNWSVVEKPDETAAALGPVVTADPGDRRSRLVLAESLRLLGRVADAEGLLSALGPDDPEALALRARLALDRGDQARADRLLAQGPADEPELATLRGRLAILRRDVPAALHHFQRAHARSPDDRDAAFGLGHALRLAGRDAEAEPILQRVRTLDTLNALVQRAAAYESVPDRALLIALAEACETLNRVPEARAWYRLTLGRDPLDPLAQDALYRLRGK